MNAWPYLYWRPWRERLRSAIASVVIVTVGLGAVAFLGSNGWLPDTPKQREERLQCETFAMQGNRPMSASDAEAFCDKEMQLEKAHAVLDNGVK
jgi:hypothetical protein